MEIQRTAYKSSCDGVGGGVSNVVTIGSDDCVGDVCVGVVEGGGSWKEELEVR